MQKPVSLLVVSLLAIFLARGDASMRPAFNSPTTGQTQATWETYTFSGEEFFVALPEMPALDHSSREVKGEIWGEKARRYGAYGDGVVYLIEAYDKPRNGEDIDHFARYFARSFIYSGRTFEIKPERALQAGEFPGKQYAIVRDNKPEGVPISSIRVFLTEKHAYALRAFGGDDSHLGVQRFFNSFMLTDKPVGRQIVDESKLPRPAVIYAGKTPAPKKESKTSGKDKEPGENQSDGVAEAATGDNSNATEQTYKASELTRKALLVSKPYPFYTEEARKNQVTGTVRLRLVATASGKITNIVALTSLPNGLTENAVLVANHIKFIPAMKDGRLVSQYITIEYNFNIY